MLQIRLSKPSNEGVGVAKQQLPAETVTVACPNHLVLADLPVAKSIGSVSLISLIKTAGRRSRRQPGERVHFCVRCDFPIAIYGRLSPCEHAFCLDCARSDSLCYLCDERIQKIQTIKLMERIFICAAPHCLKSFLGQTEFLSHIKQNHADILPNREESNSTSIRKTSASDSTVRAPSKPAVSPSLNSQLHDHEHKVQCHPSRDQLSPGPALHSRPMLLFSGPMPSHTSEQRPDGNQSVVFDGFGLQNRLPQQTLDPGGLQQDLSGSINQHAVLAPLQFGYVPYVPNGTQQIYGTSHDTARPDLAPEVGLGRGLLLNFQPVPVGALNPAQSYPHSWNMGHSADGFINPSDPQGRASFPGNRGQNANSNVAPPSATNVVERRQTGNFMDTRNGNRILPPQALPPLAPSLLPPGSSQLQQGGPCYGMDNDDPPPGFG